MSFGGGAPRSGNMSMDLPLSYQPLNQPERWISGGQAHSLHLYPSLRFDVREEAVTMVVTFTSQFYFEIIGDLKITSASAERQKRSQNLAPALVISFGNSLVFSRKIITSTGFFVLVKRISLPDKLNGTEALAAKDDLWPYGKGVVLEAQRERAQRDLCPCCT